MIIAYFRSSSYNCWSLCQQQYFINYVLGIQSPSGKKAEMGTVLHKVMESLARTKLAIQNNEDVFTDDALGEIDVDSDKLKDIRFVEWLFEKSFEYYTNSNKSIHKYYPADKRAVWKWCCDTLDFANGMFDPRKRNIVAAEPHFDIAIDEPWAHYDYEMNGQKISGQLHLKGTIDLVTEITPTHYEVIDWKSGECKDWGTGKAKDYDSFCIDPQLRMYHLAISKMYPHLQSVAMTINYVRTEGPFTVAYSDSDIEDTLKMLRKRFEQIKQCVRPKLKSPTGEHWFCKRVCWYGKTEHPDDGTKTICQYLANKTRKCGVEQVMLEDTAPGHTIDYYHDPGS